MVIASSNINSQVKNPMKVHFMILLALTTIVTYFQTFNSPNVAILNISQPVVHKKNNFGY